MIYWRTLASNLADGYTYASEQISSRLKDIKVVSLEDMLSYESNVMTLSVSEKYGIMMIPEPDHSRVIINNCLPPDYNFDGDYVIGFTYWETTRLPSDWVDQMNLCDEVWTTSKWAADVFANSGVDVPIFAFNLGVDTNVFSYRSREFKYPFAFLHVGSPSTRKNTQMAVDAFLSLFSGDDRFKLIIKSKGPPDARLSVDGMYKGGLYGHPQIEIVDHFISDEELANLFGRVNCFLYPTKGEGWGMAPFQAIATGLPTICSNATACTEFAYLSVPLEVEYSSTGQFGIYENGEWANPEIRDLCDRMVHVVNNYQEVLDQTKSGSDRIHKNYSWDLVASDFRDRILELNLDE